MPFWLLGLLTFLALLSGLWGAVFYVQYRRSRTRLDDHLRAGTTGSEQWERRSLLAGWGDRFDRTPYGQRLQVAMHQADLPFKPSEWVAVLLGVSLAMEFVLNRIFRIGFPVDVGLTLIAVQWGPGFFFRWRRSRRGRVMTKQLGEVARLLSSALKAGLTVPQGIELVARRLPAPAGIEFRRVSGELRLGVPLGQALEGLRQRSPGKDVNLLCTAIMIHREVGGDLAHGFEEMARTLAERDAVNLEIQSLTAESKFVSTMLPLMPVMAALILNMMIPGFLMPLFTPAGLIVMAVFGAVQLVGLLLIRAIARIEV